MFRALVRLFFPTCTDRQYQTVRYAFPLVIVTALFASLAAVISGGGSYVTIRSSVETVAEEETFFIDVTITAHIPINAVDLVIAYPEENLSIESIDTGTSVITLWTEEPYAENGNIYLRGGTFRKGFIGEHTLARIRAKGTASGEAKIAIEDTQLIAGDGLGTEVIPDGDAPHETKVHIVTDEEGTARAEASISIVTDMDGDGDVDLADVSAFMAAWLTKERVYDFNGDGRMTFRDFSILLADSFFR